MFRYLLYVAALYLALPFTDTIDVVTVVVFFIIIEEDARFALVFAFLTGFISDLYLPVRLGINTLVYLTLSQSLLVLKKYLVLNPLTTIATFIVFYFIKTAVLNVLVASPINLSQIIYTILICFPLILLLKKITTGAWTKN